MRNRILIGLFLSLFGTPLLAQKVVGCEQLIEDAREAYNGGMVELVPDILNECLESGLSGELLKEGYRLVINAYLFDYLPESASMKMRNFIKVFPKYEPVSSDTQEFIQLFESTRAEIEREAAVARQQAQTAAREEKEQTGGQERTSRQEGQTERQGSPGRQQPSEQIRPEGPSHSIGISVGGVLLLPQVIERYSLSDPSVDGGDYVLTTPGIQAAAVFNLNAGRVITMGFGLNYSRLHLNFSGKPFPFASYQYNEYHHRIGIPISMEVDLNPDSRTVAYFRFGVAADYLLGASASAVRTYEESGDTFFRDVEVESFSITEARTKLNLYGSAGLGLKHKTRSGYLFAEAIYHYGFRKTNNGENRYDYEDMNWLIYHIDSDFRINQLSLVLGLAWNL
jgi:hypothetical protein